MLQRTITRVRLKKFFKKNKLKDLLRHRNIREIMAARNTEHYISKAQPKMKAS